MLLQCHIRGIQGEEIAEVSGNLLQISVWSHGLFIFTFQLGWTRWAQKILFWNQRFIIESLIPES